MILKFTIPAPDAAASDKFQQFKTGFAANFGALGFDVPDLDAVIAAANDFTNGLAASELAKVAAQNAVQLKDTKREEGTVTIRDYVSRIKGNPAATPAILTALGITPASASAGPVVPPIEVSATPNANGTCKVKWKRSTNSVGTTWIVESSLDGSAWTFLATSSRTNYVDTAAAPGVTKSYRVRAQRKNVTSAPSASATIYDAGESFNLQLAA